MHHCFWQKICWLFGSKNWILPCCFDCGVAFPQVRQLRKRQISKRKRTTGQPTNHQPPQAKKYQTLTTRRFFDSEERPGTPRSFRIFSRLLHGDLAVALYVRWWCPSIFWDWFKASKRWTMWISSGRWWLFSSLQICEIPQPLQTFFKTTSWISKARNSQRAIDHTRLICGSKSNKKNAALVGFSRLPSIFFLQINRFLMAMPASLGMPGSSG